MSEPEPLARHEFVPGRLDETLEFLKRTRSELRSLRKVRVWADRFRVYDVNGDCFEVHGLGYVDGEVVMALQAVNTAFKPESIHQPVKAPYKEFLTGRRHAWAEDRVM